MSSLIVTNKHISALVNSVTPNYDDERCTYYHNRKHHNLFRHREQTGKVLLEWNKKAFHEAYVTETFSETCFYSYTIYPPYTPVQILKLCDSYIYQVDDARGWTESEAYRIITAIRDRATRNLPGYEDADWCI